MELPKYWSGTVSVENGGETVTGADTIWTGGNVREGDDFVVAGVIARVVEVVSETELTITPWTGPDAAGAEYEVYQNASRRFANVQIADDLRKQVAALNTEGFYHFVPPGATEPDPSLGDEGQYAFQATSGKLWLKTDGIWVFVGVYKPVAIKGEYDPDANYAPGDLTTRGGRLWISIQAGAGHPPESSPDYWTLFLAGGDRYDVVSFDTDRPASGEIVLKIYPRGVTFPAGLTESRAGAEVAADNDAVYQFAKDGIVFGTLTFAAGSAEGVFACAADTTFDDEALTFSAPYPRDATLSGVAITLVGYR